VDRERADLAAIKLRAAAYAASGAEMVTINDLCGTAFKGGVWETVVKLPSGRSSSLGFDESVSCVLKIED
jgi:hypothetical protein